MRKRIISKYHICLIVSFFLTSFSVSIAQSVIAPTDTIVASTDTIKEKSEVRLALKYRSDYIYLGRSANKKAPYLSPLAGYLHKSGLYALGSFSYLTRNEEIRIDLFILSAGYDHYGKQIAYGLSLSGYFYNELNYTTTKELTTAVDAFAGYDLNFLITYLSFGIGFSESTDLFIGLELIRSFYLFRDNLIIKPAFYLNAGTQNYYNEYYAKNKYISSPGKWKGSNVESDLVLIDSGKFNIKDYEAELNFIYKFKSVRLSVATTWTFPVNPASIITSEGTYKEDLKNGFYWSTGIQVTFQK
jgi:hypothetical protein